MLWRRSSRSRCARTDRGWFSVSRCPDTAGHAELTDTSDTLLGAIETNAVGVTRHSMCRPRVDRSHGVVSAMTSLEDLPLPAGVRSRMVSGINGLDVHVLEAGAVVDRPCVLLLHGFP